LTKDSNVLEIDDLLLLFNDDIKIEVFSDELSKTLQKYHNQIQ
jgi:hypothetical protein